MYNQVCSQECTQIGSWEWCRMSSVSHTRYTKLSSMLLQSKKESTSRGWTSCWKSESWRPSGQTPASLRRAAWWENRRGHTGSAQVHVGLQLPWEMHFSVWLIYQPIWADHHLDTLVGWSFWSPSHHSNLVTQSPCFIGTLITRADAFWKFSGS